MTLSCFLIKIRSQITWTLNNFCFVIASYTWEKTIHFVSHKFFAVFMLRLCMERMGIFGWTDEILHVQHILAIFRPFGTHVFVWMNSWLSSIHSLTRCAPTKKKIEFFFLPPQVFVNFLFSDNVFSHHLPLFFFGWNQIFLHEISCCHAIMYGWKRNEWVTEFVSHKNQTISIFYMRLRVNKYRNAINAFLPVHHCLSRFFLPLKCVCVCVNVQKIWFNPSPIHHFCTIFQLIKIINLF